MTATRAPSRLIALAKRLEWFATSGHEQDDAQRCMSSVAAELRALDDADGRDWRPITEASTDGWILGWRKGWDAPHFVALPENRNE